MVDEDKLKDGRVDPGKDFADESATDCGIAPSGIAG